jgi:hypothetical protein
MRMNPRFFMAAVAAALLLIVSAPLAAAQTLQTITIVQIYDPSEPLTLGVGALRQFTAYGNYSDGSQQYLTQQATWSSAKTSVATVTATMGLVTAVAPGTVNISATLDGITGSSSLTVQAVSLTAIAITPSSSWSLQVGKTLQFSATAEYGDATIANVSSTATWASSATAVATVSSTGLVTAVAAGTATISAAFGGGTGKMTLTVTTTAPANVGMWSAPQSLGMLAIHAAMLNTGNVLLWGYPVGRVGGPSPARILNPTTGSLTDVTVPWPIDIFCSAHSFLPNGTLLVDGGTDDAQYPSDSGITNTTFFTPSTNAWSTGPAMNYARWYPSTLAMPNGTILAVSGAAQNGTTIETELESYNPTTNAWTVLPTSANIAPPVDLYPLMLVLGNGNVFYAGARPNSTEFNPTTNTWSAVATMNFGTRDHAAAVLEPGEQKVMIVGGAGNDVGGGGDPTNTTEVINLTAATPAWTYGTPLNIARFNFNLLYLPDGTLMIVGGDQSQHYSSPVFQPELYSFSTNKWTLLPPQNAVRAYHATALLLPDGRVLSAGSDSGTQLENTYEFYSPAYLSKGARPTITSAPSTITYGKKFTITTPNAAGIAKVALLRAGTTTHTVPLDDNRYLTLTFTAGTGELTVTPPANANLAPPGYYMLAILNTAGVPSVMPFVNVQ